ncbi:hypothetical protein CJO78_20535 (plasmid) [Ralstonia solanacearum]|nr:hypothetical protein LBM2029_19960 [Ralstonia solanacearum]AXV79290.1 hypothetical protein CJO76_20275 [Ralstonia solanacearum]AXV88702.1 hypothetical protein CJO78_20535 [Ralstonia solanacearum]AXW08174.1 hypothetical protein CJO82_20195 [Ralstonia solanacearum]AXW21349.1 hypothetical protein CJO85_20335 [Ralstonia solanacearum]
MPRRVLSGIPASAQKKDPHRWRARGKERVRGSDALGSIVGDTVLATIDVAASMLNFSQSLPGQ